MSNNDRCLKSVTAGRTSAKSQVGAGEEYFGACSRQNCILISGQEFMVTEN